MPTRLTRFRPRARLVSILGEHLISDHVVGLVELVKNAYDADATKVTVSLQDLADPERTAITVEDNGVGMAPDDVTEKFLCPATDHKAQSKKRTERTARGRLPLGEKGVGRFAAQQLGKELELTTRMQGHSEVYARVDWTAFESSTLFLDDVEIEVEEREALYFPTTGTRLHIRGTRRAWTRADVEKLQKGLRRLRSPNHGHEDFEVELVCPEFPDLEELQATDVLDRSHYTFLAHYDPTQDILAYNYEVNHPAVKRRSLPDERVQSFSRRVGDELSGEHPACGPFFLSLHVWERTPRYLAASGVAARELNALAGVSLFRDRMRVFPYGEPGNDWLHLDRDRIQNPTERISNNQVVGFVEIQQSDNPDLVDKTNREGLIENPAFRDLRALARAAIQVFNSRWHEDRPEGARAEPDETHEPPEKPLRRARDLATAITRTAREDIPVRVETENVTQAQAARELEQQLGEVAQATDHLEQEKDVLLALAATGMAAERVVHEFGRQVTRAVQALADLRHGRKNETSLAILQACLGELRNEFRVLAPYPGSPTERITSVELLEAVDVARALNEMGLSNGRIEFTVRGNEFTARMRPASAIQVLDNLIFNAIYWVGTTSPPHRIEIELDPVARTVRVADSGPGVAPEIRARVFDAFVTTRPGGRGLGLHIVRELMRAAGGSVMLEDSVGASFLLKFGGGD